MNKTPLVLIVEDSPTQAKQIAANLARHGIRTLVASDGPEGLRAVNEHRPDLVVLDLNLPTMDGYQVCRRLKRDPATTHIPVILLTGSEDAFAPVKGLQSGVDDYIRKDDSAAENLLVALRALGLIIL